VAGLPPLVVESLELVSTAPKEYKKKWNIYFLFYPSSNHEIMRRSYCFETDKFNKRVKNVFKDLSTVTIKNLRVTILQ